jgi:hypothetical protein
MVSGHFHEGQLMLVDVVRDDISVGDDTPTSVGVFHVGDGGIWDLRLQIIDALVLVVHCGFNLGQMKVEAGFVGASWRRLKEISHDMEGEYIENFW